MKDKQGSHLSAQGQKLVERFKYTYQTPGLTEKIKEALNGQAQASEVFQIKQEIARLNNPCERVLDFRFRKDDLQVEPRELLGTTHYLDQQSLSVFLKEVKQYGNRYTLGVYEAVQQYFEKHKDTLGSKQKVLSHHVDVIRFGDTFGRDEERMNLAIPVTLYALPPVMLEDDFEPQITEDLDEIKAVTSNISRTGLKLKLMRGLADGQLVAIRFDGLEKDLVFKQRYVTYMSFHQTLNKSTGLYEHHLQLLDIGANQEFTGYLKNLIFSHKHKYKVDIESTVEAVVNKGHEQFFIDQTRSFNLYADKALTLRYWFENDYTLDHWTYFAPNGEFVLPSLLKKDAVMAYLQAHHYALYFVCRVRLKEQRVFLSAILDGSESSTELLRAFCGAKTARLYRISLASVRQDVAMATSTVPKEAQAGYGTARFHRYSQQVDEIVAELCHVLTFTPILETGLSTLVADPAEAMPEKSQIMAEGAQKGTELTRIKAESNDARAEDRFNLRTPVTLTYRGASLRGKTRDISTLGFSAQLLDGGHIPKGQTVEVRFDAFSERTTVFDLSGCKYKVVHSDNGLIRAYNGEFPEHDGRAFWHRMTSSKLDNLKVAGQEEGVYGLSRALRNLASAHTPNIHAFFHAEKGKPIISLISLPRGAYASLPMGDDRQMFLDNFRSWMYSDPCQGPLKTMIDGLNESAPESTALLMLSYDEGNLIDGVRAARLLPVDELTRDVFVNSLKTSRFKQRAVRLYAVRASHTRGEFKRYYTDEMLYVKRFAAHRYQDLRRQLTKVKGMLAFTDITYLCRYFESAE